MDYSSFVSNYDKVVCYSVNQTKYNSFILGKHVNDSQISGSIVECGIAAGGNLSLLKFGCEHSEVKTSRTFWGFDSFVGIQRAGKHDGGQPGMPEGSITWDINVPEEDLLISTGVTAHSKDNVIDNLKSWGAYDNSIVLVEGWIQHTLTDEILEDVGTIAILRLDMDVHDPTKFALEKLYPRLAKGGFLIIDDWGCAGARKATLDYFESLEIKPATASIPGFIALDVIEAPKYFVK